MLALPLLLLLLQHFTSSLLVTANELNHLYNKNNPVHLYFNKVGPYHNPQETYTYFTLPFCQSTTTNSSSSSSSTSSTDAGAESSASNQPTIKYAGLGEVLEGHGFVHSGMDLKYQKNIKVTKKKK
jgi:transmembrane 9 superfamily protein 3